MIEHAVHSPQELRRLKDLKPYTHVQRRIKSTMLRDAMARSHAWPSSVVVTVEVRL